MVNKSAGFLDLIEDILELDPQIRCAALIDLDGEIIESIMREGKQSLKSQMEEEYLCRQAAQQRTIRDQLNDPLGRVRYVHVERENVTQMVTYAKRFTLYFTMEPEIAIREKESIANRAKRMISHI